MATGFPEPLVLPEDTDESYRVFHASAYADFRNCYLNQDISSIEQSDPASAKHARKGLIQLNENAYHGLPLEGFYSSTACHESGFRIQNAHKTVDVNVLRIRKSAVRIYWCYMNHSKAIMVLRILTKREDSNLHQNPKIKEIGDALLPFFNNPKGFQERII
ncbi:hypothetical protein J564_3499 [Acinetobacter baumannii 1525283]|nr:hypothetical protein J505_3513 [Acinetobacter baumannii 1297549]EXE25271.1 hypothetical protein J564_3499 [Acinetobacter baumannii 1525283]KLT94833.1 hypothetical protein T633_1009 [Acinetobacter baumannii MRSN 58]UIY54191.1 hypothetical protein KXS17_06480 [Acinetobacter baumannii]